MSHITGGGLAANLERVLPEGVTVTLDRGTWALPAVFSLVADTGDVARADLERTLNCGVGMVALVSPEDVDDAVALLAQHDVDAWAMGEVTAATGPDDAGVVRLVGEHARA
jgi:phosphoribosylformylglycinamidine cyclo-ligase